MRARSDQIPTRKSLLGRLKSFDNTESWREFFETYWNLIYSTAIRSGLSDHEAQDVVQETIISVARSMPTFEYDPKIGSFKAWLRKVTRSRIVDHVRKHSRRDALHKAEEISDIPDESEPMFEATWESEWRRAIIEIAAKRTKTKVDAKQYQIFALSEIKGWPVKDVAASLGITAGQVYLARHRVGKIFEQELKQINLEKPV
jgi:RNA polymerase sigma factor (sigma-70 family)